MTVEPRYTLVVNIRSKDKPILDAAQKIAMKEGCDMTTVVRTALSEYVIAKSSNEGQKLDSFLDRTETDSPIYNKVLTPRELANWSEASLLDTAKRIRARQQELDSALRKRKIIFRW